MNRHTVLVVAGNVRQFYAYVLARPLLGRPLERLAYVSGPSSVLGVLPEHASVEFAGTPTSNPRIWEILDLLSQRGIPLGSSAGLDQSDWQSKLKAKEQV